MQSNNFFLRIHPLQRILIACIATILIYLFCPKSSDKLLVGITLWDVFTCTFLMMSFIVLVSRPVPQIKKEASKDDGSKVAVFILIIVSSFAAMLTALLLIISGEAKNSSSFLPLVIASVLLSWTMVHTIFTFHYAHQYYDIDKMEPNKHFEGLNFPGETSPDYLDFVYFSFGIGCTFQVSDVTISSKEIRRLVLLHTLISFTLNTFVLALSINIVAGLSK